MIFDAGIRRTYFRSTFLGSSLVLLIYFSFSVLGPSIPPHPSFPFYLFRLFFFNSIPHHAETFH